MFFFLSFVFFRFQGSISQRITWKVLWIFNVDLVFYLFSVLIKENERIKYGFFAWRDLEEFGCFFFCFFVECGFSSLKKMAWDLQVWNFFPKFHEDVWIKLLTFLPYNPFIFSTSKFFLIVLIPLWHYNLRSNFKRQI